MPKVMICDSEENICPFLVDWSDEGYSKTCGLGYDLDWDVITGFGGNYTSYVCELEFIKTKTAKITPKSYDLPRP